jgi:hypothetical protein
MLSAAHAVFLAEKNKLGCTQRHHTININYNTIDFHPPIFRSLRAAFLAAIMTECVLIPSRFGGGNTLEILSIPAKESMLTPRMKCTTIEHVRTSNDDFRQGNNQQSIRKMLAALSFEDAAENTAKQTAFCNTDRIEERLTRKQRRRTKKKSKRRVNIPQITSVTLTENGDVFYDTYAKGDGDNSDEFKLDFRESVVMSSIESSAREYVEVVSLNHSSSSSASTTSPYTRTTTATTATASSSSGGGGCSTTNETPATLDCSFEKDSNSSTSSSDSDGPIPPPLPPSQLPLRFLRAGKGDQTVGLARYEQTLQWRRDNHVDTILREAFPNFALVKAHYPHYCCGTGKNGEPCFYEQPPRTDLKALSAAGVTLDDLLHHYTMVTEFQWQYCCRDDLQRSIYIIDLKGIKFGDFYGDVVEFVKKASAMSSLHYPERAGVVFVVNVPSWFKIVSYWQQLDEP